MKTADKCWIIIKYTNEKRDRNSLLKVMNVD